MANLPQLTTAPTTAFGTAPPVLLDGLTAASPAAYAAAVSSFACTSALSGAIFDRLADNAAAPRT